MKKYSYLDHNWLIVKKCNDSIQKQVRNLSGVVYDLGCGRRPYEKDILAKADKYVGVDWSETFHDLRADIVSDLNKQLPIDDRVADAVVSFQVLEHLSEPQLMLNESFRILKPNGIIFLTVPFQWWLHEQPYDYFRFTPYGLEYLFNKAGFTDLIIEPQSGFFTMLILKMNYFTRRFVCGPKPVRWLAKLCLVPAWYIAQLAAPILDKLDKNWAAETSVFCVSARKL